MPIRSLTNNRVLNPNARAVDVAKATVDAALEVQARKVDAAFQVDGYAGILYQYLEHGDKCACQSRNRALNSRLSEDGKASPGAINELLVNGGNFGVRAYGTERKSDRELRRQQNADDGTLTVNLPYNRAPTAVALSSLFDEDDLDVANRDPLGNLSDRVASVGSIDQDVATLLVEPREYEARDEQTEFDGGLFGVKSDVSCPICFGSGFIGGFSLLHGSRSVLTFQDPTVLLPPTAVINLEKDIPSVTSVEATWTVLLSAGCLGVDALRVWNVDTMIDVVQFTVDGVVLTKNEDLLLYCDGRTHEVRVEFQSPIEFTHVELQMSQGSDPINFALPKLSKGSDIALRERTEPFQVFLSPRVPTVKTLDVLVESTYGKALQVKTVTGQNTRRNVSLGWEVDVRPVQPQEFFWMLPRRQALQRLSKPVIVRDNDNTNFNYTRT